MLKSILGVRHGSDGLSARIPASVASGYPRWLSARQSAAAVRADAACEEVGLLGNVTEQRELDVFLALPLARRLTALASLAHLHHAWYLQLVQWYGRAVVVQEHGRHVFDASASVRPRFFGNSVMVNRRPDVDQGIKRLQARADA